MNGPRDVVDLWEVKPRAGKPLAELFAHVRRLETEYMANINIVYVW